MKSNIKQSFIVSAATLLLASLTACGGANEATTPASASLSQSQPAVATSSHQSESENSPAEKK